MKIVSLLLADKVAVDENTKKVSIDGVFNLINVSGLPAKHKEFFVFIVVEGQAGKHRFDIKVKKGPSIIVSTDQEFETGSRHYFISTFKDLIFHEAGTYEVVASVNGDSMSSLLEVKVNSQNLN